jgi:hypothetical protein
MYLPYCQRLHEVFSAGYFGTYQPGGVKHPVQQFGHHQARAENDTEKNHP